MLSKIKSIKIIIFIIIFSIIISKEVDDNDEQQLFEGIIEAIKELKIPYTSYEDTIDQKIYIKLLRHLMLNEADSLGMIGNFLEDSFLLKLSREVTENLPKQIKIKDLPKYLNPRIIEPIINKILQELDLNSLIKQFGDSFGLGQKINEKMQESERKNLEREKINQARIKRKLEREKMEQNMTKENVKEEIKNKNKTKDKDKIEITDEL